MQLHIALLGGKMWTCPIQKSTFALLQVTNVTDLDATIHFASNMISSAPNDTLAQFLAAVTDGSFATVRPTLQHLLQ